MDFFSKIILASAAMLALVSCNKDDSHPSSSKRLVSPEAVDMGLSVKWASCNVGASKPEDYGRCYQWAGSQDVTNTGIYLDWNNCPYHTGRNEETAWTKYIPSDKSSYWSGSGNPDNKTVLDPEDDVAHTNFGSKWRMPTQKEWEELAKNCKWTWTDDYNKTGVAGKIATSNITGKSIFLPATGLRYADKWDFKTTYGYYWSSSLSTDYPSYAYYTYVCYESVNWLNYSMRKYGYFVRPVSD